MHVLHTMHRIWCMSCALADSKGTLVSPITTAAVSPQQTDASHHSCTNGTHDVARCQVYAFLFGCHTTASPHFWTRQQQPLPANLARAAYASWREGPGNAVAAAAVTPTTQGTSPLAAAILASKQEAAKYPAFLKITLAAAPRLAQAVTVTNPFVGERPVLPAGYGSGFETGA